MSIFKPDFKRPMGAERATLMLPLHVVMAARIRGHINLESMRSTVEKLRSRHALLAVRIIIDEDDIAWYTTKDVPPITIRTIERKTDLQWLDVAWDEYRMSFPMETGPLLRFVLVPWGVKTHLGMNLWLRELCISFNRIMGCFQL